MLSRTELNELFPQARPEYIEALAGNPDLLKSAGLDERLPYAHFLARCAAETGGFSIVEESGRYRAERLRQVWPNRFSIADAKLYAGKPQAILNRAYARKELGNGGEWSGDGWRYRGRSFMQTTGRVNYQRIGDLVGHDLERDPEALSRDFSLGLKAAVITWAQHNLTKIVKDLGPTHAAVVKVAKAINCGSVNSNKQPNGLDHQKAFFNHIWRSMSAEKVAKKLYPQDDGILEEGEEGDAVRDLQTRLLELGYPVGKPDGIYGQRTAAAVAAFQMREKLAGDPGKYRVEWAMALAASNSFADDERQQATAEDLEAEGHKPVQALGVVKKAAAGVTGFLGLDQLFGVSESPTFVGMVDGIRNTVEPLGWSLSWLASNRWAWGVGLGVGAYFLAGWLRSWFVKEYRTFGNATDMERAKG